MVSCHSLISDVYMMTIIIAMTISMTKDSSQRPTPRHLLDSVIMKEFHHNANLLAACRIEMQQWLRQNLSK